MNKSIIEMIKDVEFSSDNSQLLHKNKTENGLTYFGIYESAHPNWKGWKIIKGYLDLEPDLKKCSLILANVSDLNKLVEEFYKVEFYDKMKLDSVTSKHKQATLSTEGVHSTSKKIILNSLVTMSLYSLITLLLTSIEFALAVT